MPMITLRLLKAPLVIATNALGLQGVFDTVKDWCDFEMAYY